MRILSTTAALSCACALLLSTPSNAAGTVKVYDSKTGLYYLADADTGKIISAIAANDGMTQLKTTTTKPTNTNAPQNTAPTASADNSAVGSSKCGAGCKISVGGQCYTSLAAAIEAAPAGETISLADGATVGGEASFSKSLKFAGCSGGRAKITVDMNSEQGAVLRATGNKQKITFSKLSFVGSGFTRYSSLLRTPELGDGEFPVKETTGPVSLTVTDCDFSNFKTLARGGAVFFIGRTRAVSIANSEFRNNRVGTIAKDRYEGGGAIWFNHLYGAAKLTNTKFVDNTHEFGHGVGAGMMILDMHSQSSLDMNGVVFQGNTADSGAGLYIKDIRKGVPVSINADFIDNRCIFSQEFGCRGGAAWIQNVGGALTLQGTYSNNEAIGDRAAVIANNRIMEGGSVTIDATFRNNKCTKGASIWDTLYGFAKTAKITIKSSTVMEGNVGEGGKDMVVRLLADKVTDPNGRNIMRYEAQWKESGKTWEFVGGQASTGALEN